MIVTHHHHQLPKDHFEIYVVMVGIGKIELIEIRLYPSVFYSDDENRVKRFREKHAATVIQRGWRKHKKSHRIRHENLVREIRYFSVNHLLLF